MRMVSLGWEIWMPSSGYSLTYILNFSYLLLYSNELFKKPLCLQTACWGTYIQFLSPLGRSFCCLQLWILPPVVELIFLYAMRTMKCSWGKMWGFSEDNGASALPNPSIPGLLQGCFGAGPGLRVVFVWRVQFIISYKPKDGKAIKI